MNLPAIGMPWSGIGAVAGQIFPLLKNYTSSFETPLEIPKGLLRIGEEYKNTATLLLKIKIWQD